MDFGYDPELSSLIDQEQEENVSTPTGRVNPYPQDTNKHYAWTKTSKKNKNNGRRPTCKTESLYPPHGFEPPPPPPPARLTPRSVSGPRPHSRRNAAPCWPDRWDRWCRR